MNETIAKILDSAAAMAEAGAGITERDYIENGLLHCGACGTPKQCTVAVLGVERTVYCLCQCQQERQAKAEAVKRAEEAFENVKRLKTEGIQDKAIRGWTFANDDGRNPAMIDKAMRYHSKWRQMYDENIGILLWGNVGTGKTYFAACIANALIDNGTPVLMTSFSKIINSLSGFSIEDKNGYINDLNRYKLLIIDDLGAERQSGFAQEIVYNVIDARYKSGQPLIVTTNLTLDDIKQPNDISYSRIYDRILEMCVPVEFKGQSRRRAAYQDKIARAAEVFG